MGVCISVTINETDETHILWFKKRPRYRDVLNKLIKRNAIDDDNYNVYIFTKYDILDARYWKIKTLDLIDIKKKEVSNIK